MTLECRDSALYLMRRVTDARGALTVGEVPTEVPFCTCSVFRGVRRAIGGITRGACSQAMSAIPDLLHGSCRVLLDDGLQRCEVTLDRPDMGVFMPEMIWGTQYRYSPDAVMLVFASRPYEADDYLRTYDEFLAELERRKT